MRGKVEAAVSADGCAADPAPHADTSKTADSADAAQTDLNTLLPASNDGTANESMRRECRRVVVYHYGRRPEQKQRRNHTK
jgi:hypothetical protein